MLRFICNIPVSLQWHAPARLMCQLLARLCLKPNSGIASLQSNG